MDGMGMVHQFLPPEIQPLGLDMSIAGRAMPVQVADCTGQKIGHTGETQPVGLMLEALDDLRQGEVYICTGTSSTYALWGEMMSIRAMKLGSVGAVLGGYSRDSKGILELGFPVYSAGRYAQDSGIRGRVIDYRCTIEFPNGVRVVPESLVFGDLDGVVIIPSEQEEEVVQQALDKVNGEDRVRKAIEEGMSAREAFDTFGLM